MYKSSQKYSSFRQTLSQTSQSILIVTIAKIRQNSSQEPISNLQLCLLLSMTLFHFNFRQSPAVSPQFSSSFSTILFQLLNNSSPAFHNSPPSPQKIDSGHSTHNSTQFFQYVENTQIFCSFIIAVVLTH
jgi:hypothetical protein